MPWLQCLRARRRACSRSDSVDDQLIVEQLTELSEGRIKLPEGFQFHDSKLYIDAMAAKKDSGAKKKKKKKNKQQ